MGKPGAIFIAACGDECYAFNLEAAALTVAEANDGICFEATWVDEVQGYGRALELVAC